MCRLLLVPALAAVLAACTTPPPDLPPPIRSGTGLTAAPTLSSAPAAPSSGGPDTVVRVPAGPSNPMGYVAYLPIGYAAGHESYPVIVFLHGFGERGDGGAGDLNIISTAALPKLAATGQLPATARKFLILAPQTDAARWNPIRLHDWLDLALDRYRIDPDRLYLSGISIGGEGVFDYLAHFGDTNEFAAMAPVAGDFTPLPVPDGLPDCRTMSGTPLWAFHGDRDDTMPVQGSIQVVAYVDRECRPRERLRLTVYLDVFHDSWDATYGLAGQSQPVDATWDAYQPDLYTWFLEHTRSGRLR